MADVGHSFTAGCRLSKVGSVSCPKRDYGSTGFRVVHSWHEIPGLERAAANLWRLILDGAKTRQLREPLSRLCSPVNEERPSRSNGTIVTRVMSPTSISERNGIVPAVDSECRAHLDSPIRLATNKLFLAQKCEKIIRRNFWLPCSLGVSIEFQRRHLARQNHRASVLTSFRVLVFRNAPCGQFGGRRWRVGREHPA